MTERILALLPHIRRVFADDRSRRTLPAISWQDVSVLEAVKEGLKSVSEFTDIMSSERDVTISSLLPLLHLMKDTLKEEDTDAKLTAEIKRTILEQLDNRYDNDKAIQLMRTATLLDPRYKASHMSAADLENIRYLLEDEMVLFWKRDTPRPPVRVRMESADEEDAGPSQPIKKKKTLGSLLGTVKPAVVATPEQRAHAEMANYLQEEVADGETNALEWWRGNDTRNISKNCTAAGWSDVFPNITSVCWSEPVQDKLIFYMVIQTLYTLGHSLSLIALTTGSAILCLFRKLHCTRNYIHLNLFFSFILRAVAVLVKDDILFSRDTQCSNQPSLMGCKASLVFFHYFIMANFFWLLVEGLYLHTLLTAIFFENRRFIVYLLIGWGIPTVFVSAWAMTRVYLEDTGCWERNDNLIPNWVINGPIGFSILVNFILFISIIRILLQKLRCPDVGGNDQSQYRRLAKSTLLLIPLFGIHYVVFASLSESIAEAYRIFFDLAIGSFQGLVVAILYCFLNSEVQGELKRKWRSVCLNCRLSRDHHFSSIYASRNGSEHTGQFHRSSRTQSILQSETTVL
ncbi:vasoactive intestinal polypeptide receptor 2-like [Diretmus argenteus]